MRYTQIIIWLSSIVLILSGCNNIDKEKVDINEMLLGNWELDSISSPSGMYFKEDTQTKKLMFINKTDYSLVWMNGDVGNTYTGKYFVLDNPNRGLKTISFIPDVQIAGKDTIRIEFMNLDIVSLNSKRLQLIDETKFIKRDSLPSIKFNKNYIYKRMK